MTKWKQYLVGVMFLFVLFVLQYRLWIESGGMKEMWKLKKMLSRQNIENEKLKKSNEEILLQIQRLQKSQDAVESSARSELGMIKKEEKFYRIIP